MKDDPNFLQVGWLPGLKRVQSTQESCLWLSVLSSVCEKLIRQVLVQRNSLLAYIIIKRISVTRHSRRNFLWHFCNLLLICVNEMLIQ